MGSESISFKCFKYGKRVWQLNIWLFFAVVILQADMVFKKMYQSGNRSQLPLQSLVLIPFRLVTFVVLIVTMIHKESHSMCLKKDVDENSLTLECIDYKRVLILEVY